MKLLDGLEPKWWTPEGQDELPEDAREAYFIRPLNGPEMLDVQTNFDQEAQTITAKGLTSAVRNGLLDWRNIGDSTPFVSARIKDIPGEWIALIGAEIIAMSYPDEEEVKN